LRLVLRSSAGKEKPQIQNAFAAALFLEVPRLQQIIQRDETKKLSRASRVTPFSAIRYTTARKGSSGKALTVSGRNSS
jgi:hypothetical protein